MDSDTTIYASFAAGQANCTWYSVLPRKEVSVGWSRRWRPVEASGSRELGAGDGLWHQHTCKGVCRASCEDPGRAGGLREPMQWNCWGAIRRWLVGGRAHSNFFGRQQRNPVSF